MLKRIRPSAFRSRAVGRCGSNRRRCGDLQAHRARAFGSRANAGRYSLLMIDGGTFQVGLTVMYFIVSVSRGVAWLPTLPATILVCQTVLPVCTTFRVKSGRLTIT